MKKTLLTLALASTALVATNAHAGFSTVVLDGPNATLKATATIDLKAQADFNFNSTQAYQQVTEKSVEHVQDSSLELKAGFAYDKKFSEFTSVNVIFDYKTKQGIKRTFENETTNGLYPKDDPLTKTERYGDLLGPDWNDYKFKLKDTRYGTVTFSNSIGTVFSQETEVSLNPGIEKQKYGRGIQYQSPVFNGLTFFASYNNTTARQDTPTTAVKNFDYKALRVKYELADNAAVTGQELNFSYIFGHSHKKVTPVSVEDDGVRRVESLKAAELNYSANFSGLKFTGAYAFATGHLNYVENAKGNEHAVFFKAAYDLHQYVTLEANYGFRRINITKSKTEKANTNEHVFKLSYGSNSLPLVYGTSVEFGLGYEFKFDTTTESVSGKKQPGSLKNSHHNVSANVTFNLL